MRGCTLLVSIWTLATGVAAEVQDTLEYTYYDAPVTAGQRLGPALTSASPINENGRVFHGHTKWNVHWNFRWSGRGDGTCMITRVTISFTANITMPRLVGGDAAQRQAFERYVAALKLHEMGHYQIGKDAALGIDQKILTLPTMEDCGSLKATANAGAYRILASYQDKERQYDADTEHGKTQGAWLDK